MFEDPSDPTGGGATSDPPTGTGGTGGSKSIMTDETPLTEDSVTGFTMPTGTDDTQTTGTDDTVPTGTTGTDPTGGSSPTSDPPTGTGGTGG